MKKVVLIGVLYLLWQFVFGGPELVQADGRRYVQQHRSQPRFSIIVPVIIPVPSYPSHRIYTPRVPSYPRSYGQEFRADGIYVSGSGEAKEAAEGILLDMGKSVLTQSYGNVGAELRITERTYGNVVILSVELRDLGTRELLDRREGRADFDPRNGLSRHEAYTIAAKRAIESLRII